MININLHDTSFSHLSHSVPGKISKNINWIRDSHTCESSIHFYTHEQCLRETIEENSYAFLIESQAIIPGVYGRIHKNIDKFKLVFTHSSELLKYSNARWIPGSSCWINGTYGGGEYKIYEKTKNISMLSSNKTMCQLHIDRLNLTNLLKSLKIDVDIFGTANDGNWIPVIATLKDYRYSIVIENYIDDSPYLTEKLLNCFATGTIPIYLGSKNVSKLFDENGIIFLEKTSDIFKVLPTLTEESYYSRINAIEKNLELSKKYDVLEDYIFEHYLKGNV